MGARRGPTTARLLASQLGIVGRTLSSAAVAAGLGGIAGFSEGNSLQDRASIGQGARRHVPNAGKESAHPPISESYRFGETSMASSYSRALGEARSERAGRDGPLWRDSPVGTGSG